MNLSGTVRKISRIMFGDIHVLLTVIIKQRVVFGQHYVVNIGHKLNDIITDKTRIIFKTIMRSLN